jgi:hypothetical protein
MRASVADVTTAAVAAELAELESTDEMIMQELAKLEQLEVSV